MPLFLQPFVKFADFNGRARRAEYWQWCLFQMAVGFVLGILRATAGHGGGGIVLLNALFSLAVCIPSLAVTVRRLHDTNRTGWWVLFPSAVACLMVVIFFAVAGPGLMAQIQKGSGDLAGSASDLGRTFGTFMTLVIVPALLASLVVFVFMVLPGTTGPNRFGGDPKGGMDISRVFDAPESDTVYHNEDAEPYKPVFDFGPNSASQSATPARDAPVTPATSLGFARPATGFSAPARPVFGKRGQVS